MNKGEDIKNMLMTYTLATIVCYFFDGVNFIIQYRYFSVPGHEHTDLILMIASLMLFVLDLYYLFWVLMLKQKLPPSMSVYVSDAILGMTKKMRTELYKNL